MSMSSYFAVAPKVPSQERGERRVAELLEAAEAVIAETGYEAATMSAIAERAGAAIGSLYQFFPNKACITQALRIEYGRRFGALLAPLVASARSLNREDLVGHLIELTVRFVDAHPALPALLDAPRVTRSPAAMRNALRDRLAAVLLAQSPKLAKDKALRMGTVTLHVIKAMNQLYAELPSAERRKIVQEFKMLFLAYFNARIAPSSGRRGRR
jgi:AcrR family transcriptional regulator